jgi:DNA-binding NtrC family response regulator
MERILAAEGHTVRSYQDPQALMSRLRALAESEPEALPDLVISDLMMPGMNGLEFVHKVKPLLGDRPILFITAHGTVETAVQAMREGAFDFLLKPLLGPEIKVAVQKALDYAKLQSENQVLRTEVNKSWKFKDLIGRSRSMQNVFSLVERVGHTDVNVLILGESGTGKELVARGLHNTSDRATQPFIAINCGAIPENLLESELFGHAKGSFTGAVADKEGLFRAAHGGTLFLDEIGDMSLLLQVKLLRVLQDKKVRPVGKNEDLSVDVRIVAATHRDLRKEIAAGHFREDLYYRLAVLPIHLPPLRERREDIPLLASHFLRKYSAAHNLNVRSMKPEVLKTLMDHSWPGNIRELENSIERALVLCDGTEVKEISLGMPHTGSSASNLSFPENWTLQDLERAYIEHVLLRCSGVKEKAAKVLGINRKTLYRKEKEYGFGAIGPEPDDETLLS